MINIIELLDQTYVVDNSQSKHDIKSLIQKLEKLNCSLEEWQQICIHFYRVRSIQSFMELIDYIILFKLKEKKYEDDQFNGIKIKIINSLSAYYLNLASIQTEQDKREEYFDKMKTYVNLSDKISIGESLTFALKGFLFFYQGEFKKAQQYFEQSQIMDEKCISAILGKALIEYHNQNYEESIRLYQKAININPSLPDHTMIGLANSYFNLEKYQLAYQWYSYILEQDANNIQSVLGLMNYYFRKKEYQNYQKYLQMAYNIDKNNPELLAILSEQYLIKNDQKQAKILATIGHTNLMKRNKFIQNKSLKDNKKVKNDYFILKSKFLFILGFCAHSENNYLKAQKYYKEAIQSDEFNFQAQINLGQVYIGNKNYIDALKCYEYVIEHQKKKFEEIYKILGYLYQKNGKRNESLYYYRLALKFDENDYETWIEYANILETSDEQESLNGYLKALKIMNDNSVTVSPEIHNNIGVLQIRLKKHQEGYQQLVKGAKLNKQLEESENGQERLKGRSIHNCIQFNIGIFFEQIFRFGEATEIYKGIINTNPYYIDSYLKLSYLNYIRGSQQKAIEYSNTAIKKIEQTKQRPDLAICWKAYMVFKQGDYQYSKQLLEDIKQKYEYDDIYAQLFISFINYKISVNYRNKVEEQRYYLKKMIDIARDKLQQDPQNIQAALILGCFMGELSYFRESKEILNQLYVGSSLNNNIQLNISHLEFLQKSYLNSIRILQSQLNKQCQPDTNLLVQLALNYFQIGDYGNSKKQIQKAILYKPHKIQLRYNLNILIYNWSQSVLETKKNREKELTQKSIDNLNSILKLFEYFYKSNSNYQSRLGQISGEDKRKIYQNQFDMMREKSELRFNYIAANKERFIYYLQEDEKEMIRNIRMKEQIRQIQDQQKQEQIQQQEKQRLQQLKLKQEKQERAERVMADNYKIQQEIQEQLIQIKNKSKKKQRKKKDDYEDEYDPEQDIKYEDNKEDQYDPFNVDYDYQVKQQDQQKVEEEDDDDEMECQFDDQDLEVKDDYEKQYQVDQQIEEQPKRKKLKKLNDIEQKEEEEEEYDFMAPIQ